MISFHVITLFPESIRCYCEFSIISRAIEAGHIEVKFYNPMDYTSPRSEGALPQRVDAKSFGGGPGMVLRAEPIISAVKDAVGKKRNVRYIHFAPRGEKYNNTHAEAIAQAGIAKTKAIRDVVLICGRYEGIDSRIEDIFPGEKFSMGDYVTTGGELPAMTIIDSVTRRIPGVLGERESLEEERTAPEEYYTRPRVLQYRGKKYEVPGVLVEGNHKEIEKYRSKKHQDK